ncbi:DUF2470 domain-containing protein [Kitasatospora sp. NPDC085879]|uniref:DUF2470 domain-containing protein n=1 Tax=Kitasatospora sp. NPDC085879 TaxID=3154769 RepID=UPI00343CACD7
MSAAVPSAAERVRTLLEFASSVVLDVPGIDLVDRPGPPPLVDCAVLPDGAVAVLVEEGSPVHRIAVLARGENGPVTAELDAVDVAPVAMPHRIRGRAAVQGRLGVLSRATPARIAALFPRRRATGHALLCLEPEHLAVEDLRGSACCIEPADFAAAAADPLAAEEALLLQHLDAAHADQVLALGLRAAGQRSVPRADSVRAVRPVALDRFGLRLRLVGEDGRVLDARFEFGRPVRSAEELPDAMRRLFTHATADR